MGNEWIDFVKKFSKDNGISYVEALKVASKPYRELKGKGKQMKGSGLKSITFQKLLEASYSGDEQVEGFTMDKSISSKTSKVYVHPSGQVVVAHRGTSGVLDWGNNAMYGLVGDIGYKITPRYKEALKVQQNAEKKYGAKNITTIGHSQGGLQAQLLGDKSREIITLNKATRPQEFLYGSSKKKNQYDVRASGDLVSLFRNPLQLKNEQTINDLGNPLKSHSTDILGKKKIVFGDTKTYVN